MWEEIVSVVDGIKKAMTDLAWDVIGSIFDLVADLVELIPVPDWLDDLSLAIDGVPQSSLFWLEPFQIPYGLSIISAALTSRMIISVIPFVGNALR